MTKVLNMLKQGVNNFFKQSLAKRALLGIIVIFIPIGVAFIMSYHMNKAHAKKRVLDDLTVIAEAYEGQVYLFLERLRRDAEDFASDGFIRIQLHKKIRRREFSADTISKHLTENKLPLNKTAKTIHILTLDGQVVASTNKDDIGMDVSGEGFFLKGKNGTSVTEYYTAHGGLPMLAISTPIFSKNSRELIGVLVNYVGISELNKILSGEYIRELGALSQNKEGRWETMEVYLVNKDKFMVTESHFVKNAILRQVVDTLPVEACFTSGNETTGFYKDYRGVEVLGASMFIPSLRWVLLAEVDKCEVFAPIRRMLINAVVTASVVIGMIGMLYLAFIKKMVYPLRTISDAARDIACGNPDVVIPVTTRDELGVLCESFNRMSREIKAREAAQQQLISIINSTSDFIGMAGLDGKAMYLNAAARKMLGIEEHEDVSRIHISGTHPAWAAKLVLEEGIPAAMQQGVWSGETAFLTRDGREIPVSQVIMAHKDSNGVVMYLSTIVRDITERKGVEEMLRKSENKYRTLLENLPQKIFYKDRDLKYVSCNENYARDLKISPEDIAGRTDYDFYPDKVAEKYQAGDKRIMESGRTVEIEEKYVRDRHEMIVRTVKTPVRDENGNVSGILGIFWDITEFKKAAEEQQRLKEQLYHMQRLESIGTLAGGVAHDFNNILALIMGYGSLLEKEMEKDDSLRVYVQKILASAERAANLTHSLLAFSRKQITNPKPVQVNEIIKKMESLLPRIIGEDVKLRTALTDKECVVMANGSQLEQVLMNLITNARDAMPLGGSLVISTDVMALDSGYIKDYGYCEAGKYALISVSDTGIGMDKKTLERIFEPFFTTKEVGKGTGIGLSIVYGIVKQHKGFIQVCSKPHRGTTFKIHLPLTESTTKDTEETKSEDLLVSMSGTETILMAEDEAEIMELTKTVFEEYGYKVINASDGEDAVDKFMKNKDKVQFLVLDVRMPRKNGKEAYETIKKIKPDIKALFTSGYINDIINAKDISGEGLSFISKPVLPTDLLRKVRETLDAGDGTQGVRG